MGNSADPAMAYQDMFNRPLVPGDYITYAAMHCDSPCLRVGRILELTQSKSSWKPVPKLKVRALEHNYQGWGLLPKAVSLEHFSRICKLEESQIPTEIKTLLHA